MGIASEYVLNKQTAGHTKRKAKHARACVGCGIMFVSERQSQYHSDKCRKNNWQRLHPPVIITAAMVRKEDGLDRPKVAHVCHYYPPAYRCLCGKRMTAAMTANGD
jgi:hypothetical protein